MNKFIGKQFFSIERGDDEITVVMGTSGRCTMSKIVVNLSISRI
jgi:hypothetical protein